jgi:hypothetical protein
MDGENQLLASLTHTLIIVYKYFKISFHFLQHVHNDRQACRH